MRRTRCPHCDHLAEHPTYIAATREGEITAMGSVCDNCDCSWDSEKERREIKAQRKARRPC